MTQQIESPSVEREALCDAMMSLTDHLDSQDLGHLAYCMSGKAGFGIVVVRENPKLEVPEEWKGFRVETRKPEFGALKIA